MDAETQGPTRATTQKARAVVRRHSLYAAATGLIPIPAIDFVATSGVTLHMLQGLAEVYGIEFRTESARASVSAMLSSSAATLIAFGPARSAIGAIPVVGTVAQILLGPAAASAFTLAIGRVFTMHFGLGGDLHDFDPEKYTEYFAEQLQAARSGVGADSAEPRPEEAA